jgi:hypothetical protein
MEDGAMSDETAPGGDLDPMAEQVLDGNAIAGLLVAAFGSEMTAVPGECAHCGRVHLVGSMRAYVRAPGTVLRCPTCSEVILRIVQTPSAILVDARGAAWLRLER